LSRCSSGSFFAPRRNTTASAIVTTTGTKIEIATMICVHVDPLYASIM